MCQKINLFKIRLLVEKTTKPLIFSWFERMINHTGTETRSRLSNLASSEEYWTMNESLIQQYYVNEEG